jgi:hypothetical protein
MQAWCDRTHGRRGRPCPSFGNYKFCWLSGYTGLTGACLDQLWLR